MPALKLSDEELQKRGNHFDVVVAEEGDMHRPLTTQTIHHLYYEDSQARHLGVHLVAPRLVPLGDGVRHARSDALDRRRDEEIVAFTASIFEAIAERIRAPLDWKSLKKERVVNRKSRCVRIASPVVTLHTSTTFSSVASTPQHPHRHGSPPSSQRDSQSRAASDRSSTSGASKGNILSERLDFQQQSRMGGLSGVTRGEQNEAHTRSRRS